MLVQYKMHECGCSIREINIKKEVKKRKKRKKE